MEHVIFTLHTDDEYTLWVHLNEMSAITGVKLIAAQTMILADVHITTCHFEGTWNAIAKLETVLERTSKTDYINVLNIRSQPKTYEEIRVPLTITITAIQVPLLITEIAKFFMDKHITIAASSYETYHSHQTQAPMFRMTLSVHVPDDVNIIEMREDFLALCEEYNFLGTIESEQR